jgi:hypothetical protein
MPSWHGGLRNRHHVTPVYVIFGGIDLERGPCLRSNAVSISEWRFFSTRY